MTERCERVIYRVLVFGHQGAEILLTRSTSGLELPEVIIPRWDRVADNITSAMKREWGRAVICLFEPDCSNGRDASRYVTAIHWSTCATPSTSLHWTSMSELSAHLFAHPRDYRAIREALSKCFPSASDAAVPAFARLSWFEELCGWVGEAIASRRLRLTGDFRQLNACPTFSLVRFETNGPAVWFKAVGEPNLHEFALTVALAKLFPNYTPEIISTRGDWNGWLMFEAEGVSPSETADPVLWERAFTALAKLQIESVTSCSALLDSGAADLKPATLTEIIPLYVDLIAELMDQQPRVPPPVLSVPELRDLGERISNTILDLEKLRIPDTLGHLDLNPGNVLIASNACVFLDWAGAYIGHPFCSLQYLLQHFRRAVGEDPAAEAALTSAYLAPWKDVASPEALAEAVVLARLVAVFAFAAGTVGWRQRDRLRDSKVAGYMRSLARRMKREADYLSERKRPCLH